MDKLTDEQKADVEKLNKKYLCSCGKFFIKASRVRAHEQMHTQSYVKKFKCTECDKAFGIESQLKRHNITHTEERPYSCDFCGKQFRTKDNVRQHIVVHTGEARYQCTKCMKKFKFAASKQNHKCIPAQDCHPVHSVRVYSCHSVRPSVSLSRILIYIR